MARSRSGTRNTRGPRKPQRRTDGFTESAVQTIDPSSRGAVEIPNSIMVKELAELIGVNPADIIRELIKSGIFANINQVIDRDTASLVTSELGYEVAEARAPEPGVESNGDDAGAGGDQGGPLRGGRSVQPRLARPDRHRDGPRRPRQDQPARRDPLDDRGGRRAWRHHPAHRRERDRAKRPPDRLPGHARSRGVHRHARPRREGDRHRRPGRRRAPSRPTASATSASGQRGVDGSGSASTGAHPTRNNIWGNSLSSKISARTALRVSGISNDGSPIREPWPSAAPGLSLRQRAVGLSRRRACRDGPAKRRCRPPRWFPAAGRAGVAANIRAGNSAAGPATGVLRAGTPASDPMPPDPGSAVDPYLLRRGHRAHQLTCR